MTEIPLKEWLDAAEVAADELSLQVLNLPPSRMALSAGAQLPNGLSGASIALAAGPESILVGLSSHPEGLTKLAKAMLSAGAKDTLADADLRDAVGEMANIIAGSIKRQLTSQTEGIKLGLPKFALEAGFQEGGQENGFLSLRMGDVPVHVFVAKKKSQ